MLWVESLCWTSRAEVCDRLAQFLCQTSSIPIRRRDYTRPASVPARYNAARLLAFLAEPSAAPTLRRLVGDEDEAQSVRIQALQALVNPRAEVPLPELRRWLEDRSLWTEITDYCYLADLISLFRSDDARPLILSFVTDWPPKERARLLLDCLKARRAPASPEIVNVLYDAWAGSEHELLEGATVPYYDPDLLNVAIARHSPDRAQSRALLIDRWRRAESEQRPALLNTLWLAIGELPASIAQGSDELAELANVLVLAPAALVEYFGPAGLLTLLEEKVRAANRDLQAEPRGASGQVWSELYRASSLARSWPDGGMDDRLASWICCPDLSPHLAGELLRLLWERNPDRGAAVLRFGRAAPGLLPVVRHFLLKDAYRLRGSERDFLAWAAGQDEDPIIRYYAVQAIEKLGDDSLAWRRRLRRLAGSDDPYMRLHALAALARRGETTRMEAIIDAAANAEHVCVRAEALRILGEADAGQHRALLHRAMLEEVVRCDHRSHGPWPVFGEAWRGLMRLDPPDALTELVQSYLAYSGWHNPNQFGIVLRALVHPGVAEAPSGRLFGPEWGRCRGEQSEHDWPDLVAAERRWGNRKTARASV